MYLNHFGLIQYPFSLAPNTRYFLKLPAYQKAFEQLIESLDGPHQFSIITGEVGTGKTLLCRKALTALDVYTERYTTGFIPNPILNEENLMHAIIGELGLEHDESLSYGELLKIVSSVIINFGKLEKTFVLFIDEAQAMPEESLAALSLLTAIAQGSKGFQVILFGQPELDDVLQLTSLQAIRSNVSFAYELSALAKKDIKAYIDYRLLKAGHNGQTLFSSEAVDLLYEASKGVPRLINILGHKSMMVAYGRGQHIIDASHAKNAIADTDSIEREKTLRERLFGF